MSSYRDEQAGEEEEDEEVSERISELAGSCAPDALRGIRACKRCGLLKTIEQFVEEGCENCPFLNIVSFGS